MTDMEWQPIETAPKDGTHILVANFTPGAAGFGWFNGSPDPVPWQAVAHYWSHPGEEGFYLSTGTNDEPLHSITHWRPLLPKPGTPSEAERMRAAIKQVSERKFSTFRRRGKDIGIEADDGEKVWLVHSDDIFDLESAAGLKA